MTPEAPRPDRPKCQGMCRDERPAVIAYMMERRDGATIKTVPMYLCAECAGPLVKKGQPLGAPTSTTP
jgi:hypothetical protein